LAIEEQVIFKKLSDCNVFIVTVPTPIDKYNAPDLKPLLTASKMLGEILKRRYCYI
jgi:UDP-N-acetyl-D-galactosamine dehydrogenase